MKISRSTFDERRSEIESYFDFIDDIITNKAKLTFPASYSNPVPIEKDISIELTHTLKANAYLLLYNLVEATMSNAIEEIHDEISSCQVDSVDKLIDPLNETILRRFHTGKMQRDKHLSHPASKQLLQYWLDDYAHHTKNNKNPLFSGTLDARRIREIADLYGFSDLTNESSTNGGKKLVEVKSKRNDLAHGHVGFRECGLDLAMTDLTDIKNEVIAYLDEILNNIESYISNRGFLRPPPPKAPPTPLLKRLANAVLNRPCTS